MSNRELKKLLTERMRREVYSQVRAEEGLGGFLGTSVDGSNWPDLYNR